MDKPYLHYALEVLALFGVRPEHKNPVVFVWNDKRHWIKENADSVTFDDAPLPTHNTNAFIDEVFECVFDLGPRKLM